MTNEEKVIDNQTVDPRITGVENTAKDNIANISQTYDDMILGSDTFYDSLSKNIESWEATQTELQKKQGQLAIDKLENQKGQAEKDYIKEQQAAYTDYEKKTQKHGVNAEQMAMGGFTGSGYSESAQVAMYNTYQNRVATARAAYEQVKADYEISIADAKLKNDATLAEIAFESMQKRLELSLEGFQYKNSLLIEKSNQITNAKNTAWGQYIDVLNQINQENTLKQNAEQFDRELQWEKDKLEDQQNFQKAEAIWERDHDFALQDAKTADELKLLEAKTAAEKELLEHEASLYEGLIPKDGETATTTATTTKTEDDGKNGGGVIYKGDDDLYGYTIEREKVTNDHGTNWVTVKGLGNMTWGQLQKKVESGEVTANKVAGKTTYTYEGKPEEREEFNSKGVNESYLKSLIGNGYITKVTEGGKTKYYWTKLGKQMQNSM